MMLKTIDFTKIQNIVGVKNLNDRNGRSGSSINTSKEGTAASHIGSSSNSLQRKFVTSKEE